MNWMLRRLREPSTWRGLVWLATVAGLSLRPEQAEAIVTVGMALTGLLGVFLSDESKNISIELPPVELIGQSQGYNDASQDMDSALSVKAEGPGADTASQNPVVRKPGVGVKRSDYVPNGVRQFMPAERRSSPHHSPDLGGFGDRN